MIVVGVISILSVAIITVINPADQIQKANDGRRKSDLLQIQKSLEQYYQDNGRYPASTTDGSYQIVSVNQTPLPWGSSWIPYMNLLPKDPSGTKYYQYVSDSSGQIYYLYASLDRGSKDKDACKSGAACNSLLGISPMPTCGSVCNYGASSPNVSP